MWFFKNGLYGINNYIVIIDQGNIASFIEGGTGMRNTTANPVPRSQRIIVWQSQVSMLIINIADVQLHPAPQTRTIRLTDPHRDWQDPLLQTEVVACK